MPVQLNDAHTARPPVMPILADLRASVSPRRQPDSRRSRRFTHLIPAAPAGSDRRGRAGSIATSGGGCNGGVSIKRGSVSLDSHLGSTRGIFTSFRNVLVPKRDVVEVGVRPFTDRVSSCGVIMRWKHQREPPGRGEFPSFTASHVWCLCRHPVSHSIKERKCLGDTPRVVRRGFSTLMMARISARKPRHDRTKHVFHDSVCPKAAWLDCRLPVRRCFTEACFLHGNGPPRGSKLVAKMR